MFDVTFLLSPLDVHLRRGVPGRAHRAGTRAGAGLLQLRRPLHRRRGRRRRRGRGRAARPTEQWQFRSKAPQGGWLAHREGRHPHHPPRRRRLHLPQPPGLRRRRRAARCTRRRSAAGERPMDWKPDVCWQLPLRLAGAHRRARPRHVARCGSGSGATGARAATSSTGGAPTRPTRSSAREPVYVHDARRDRRDGRRAGLRAAAVRLLDAAQARKTHVLPHPAVRR